MRDQKLIHNFPVDICLATEQFHLEGKSTVYAVCPDSHCHCMYRLTFMAGSPIPSYPTVCTYRQYTSGRHCKQLLTRLHCFEGKEVHVPIKTFALFDFIDWVAGLLSRAELEKYMDATWDTASHGVLGNMHDIFDGKVL